MKALIAFIKKELLEQMRSGKLIFTAILFTLVGVMNPAFAKLTPWLLETMADSLAESGMNVTEVTVSAMDSWVQFFKNIPLCLIAFVLLESAIFTKEYSSGTLILSLTKGLSRWKVVIAKSTVLIGLWTLGYVLCFGISYGYSAYFWDNSVVGSLGFAVFIWWLFGVCILSLTVLASVIANANTGVLVGCGGAAAVSYLLGIIPKVNKYLPTMLTDGNSLIYGKLSPDDYVISVIITASLSVICFAVSIPLFNKKQL